MHVEILDETRQRLLPQIAEVGVGFYLAGGTALALQLGHRDSIDFDFFTTESFSTSELYGKIQSVFTGSVVSILQQETNTLTVLIDNTVQLSFFSYQYSMLESYIKWEGMSLAAVLDISAMKLSAITARSTMKDYVDLYTILQLCTLSDLLEAALRKFPELNQNLILKSLVYFDDIEPEPIRFMPGFEVDLEQIKRSIVAAVRKYQAR